MIHAMKPSFFRPSSRPSSPLLGPHIPRPDSEMGMERTARPLHKLSLSTFRRASPATNAGNQPAQVTLVQDGSYLDALSLKIGEAVSKALSLPTSTVAGGDVLNGKRPIPPGRGHALGELIAGEFKACHGNVHLQRAILRLLQRPLAVLLTNISAQLLPLLSSSAFLSPPAPTPLYPNPNPTQSHALAFANFAGELLDVFDTLDIDPATDPRGDGLRKTQEGFVSLIGRVVSPLVGGLKRELLPLIQGLENAGPVAVSIARAASGHKSPQSQHTSVVSLQALMPTYARALARYTESSSCQAMLATLHISLIWRTLVALSNRHSPSAARSDSASTTASQNQALTTQKKRLGGSTTPPSTPPSSRFNIKLPPSRPPSPPAPFVPSAADDARAVYDLLGLLPKPPKGKEAHQVAREAVDEAFDALAALTALLGAVGADAKVREDLDLELLTDGLPVLIALPVLLRWAGHGDSQVIPAMLGISDAEYREGCLSGFGRAEECAPVVAQRVLEALRKEDMRDAKTEMVMQWLESKVAPGAAS